MAANEKSANDLLDALVDMLVENRALRYVLDDLCQHLPAGTRDRLLADVEHLRADPNLRAAVADRFAQFRGQSTDEILPELLKRFPKIKSQT